MPHFLFAYANDHRSQTGFLRTLARERKAVKAAMDLAEQMGLCQRAFIDDASASDIVNAFQRHNGDVVLFHYGGHADSFELLLQSEAGDDNQLTGGEGLVSFLGRQRGLKIVVLNGCHTLPLAQSLIAAGVPVVIGTHRAISDQVATLWAERFYLGLGVGLSVQRAFDDAVDAVRMSSPGGDHRSLFLRTAATLPSDVPWSIKIAPEQDDVRNWSLTEFDPLLGLPEPPVQQDLPDPPFLFIRRYDRAHAPVFFGRAQHIRILYDRVANADSPPLILLHGQSGSGKSSLFDAGLVPRLEADYLVRYLRRDGQKGLAKTLLDALEELAGQDKYKQAQPSDNELDELLNQLEQKLRSQALDRAVQQQLQGLRTLKQRLPEAATTDPEDQFYPTLLRLWRRIESGAGRPLVVILDQVEEVFTQSNPAGSDDEWQSFMAALGDLFGQSQLRPAGKLILGFRKEYFPEIEKALQSRALPRSSIFLPTLSRSEIEEIVNGLTSRKNLRERYQLQIEPALPGMIAGELLQQEASTVAPILQIMLTNMWEAAKAAQPHRPAFTVELYRQLKAQWWQLDKFVKAQIDQVANTLPDAVEGGLLLDLLYEHSTSGGTSRSRTLEELEKRYAHIPEWKNLVRACERHLLLKQDGSQSSLSHDTLAPIVRSMYQQSGRSGQRARRILEGRVQLAEDALPQPLDRYDLGQVLQGQAHMRSLTHMETALLVQSRMADNRRRGQKAALLGALGLVGLVAIGTTIYGYRENARKLKTEATLTTLEEKRDSLTAEMKDQELLLSRSQDRLNVQQDSLIHLQDASRNLLEINEATQKRAAGAERLFAANQLAANALVYLQEGKKFEALQAALAAYKLVPESPAVFGALLKTAYDPDPIIQPMQSGYTLLESGQRNAKGYRLSGINDAEFKVYDTDGKAIFIYPSMVFLDDAPRFVAQFPDRAYFKLDGREQIVIWAPVFSLSNHSSPVSGKITGLADGGPANGLIWASSNGRLGRIGGTPGSADRPQTPLNGEIQSISLSSNGQLAVTLPTTLRFFKLPDFVPSQILFPQSRELAFQRARFSSSGRYIFVVQMPDRPVVYDLESGQLQGAALSKTSENVNLLDGIFSPDERFVIGRDQRKLYVWDWRKQKHLHTQLFEKEINSLAFNPNGRQLLIGSADGRLYTQAWPISGAALTSAPEQALILDAGIVDLAFWSGGSQRVAVAAGNRLHFYEWESRLPLGTLELPKQIRNLLITKEGDRLWIGTEDGLFGPVLLDVDQLAKNIQQHIFARL